MLAEIAQTESNNLIAEPIRQMLTRIMAYLPVLLGALLILLIGWLVAKAIKRIVDWLLKTNKASHLCWSDLFGMEAASWEAALDNGDKMIENCNIELNKAGIYSIFKPPSLCFLVPLRFAKSPYRSLYLFIRNLSPILFFPYIFTFLPQPAFSAGRGIMA